MQTRARVAEEAAKLGVRAVRPALQGSLAMFLREQPFLVVASSSPSGQIWASLLTGLPGFAVAASPNRVTVRARVVEGDPLDDALSNGPALVGVLAIDPGTRSRIRINGAANLSEQGFELEVKEAFGNCPKYIQRRIPIGAAPVARGPTGHLGDALDASQRAIVTSADTFFIASRHGGRGADASHRGGQPGFVCVAEDGRSLTFPDYQGNNMFQTLGNLTADPAAGLLFIEWETGRTLQIAGRASVVWEGKRLLRWPGADRLVDIQIEAVIDRLDASPLRWALVEPHRLNPPAPLPAAGGTG